MEDLSVAACIVLLVAAAVSLAKTCVPFTFTRILVTTSMQVLASALIGLYTFSLFHPSLHSRFLFDDCHGSQQLRLYLSSYMVVIVGIHKTAA